jgi:hypothetical protein
MEQKEHVLKYIASDTHRRRLIRGGFHRRERLRARGAAAAQMYR